MPPSEPAPGTINADIDTDDNLVESEPSDDDASDDEAEALPCSLSELQKSIAGDTRQAPIDAYSPVSDIREMTLLMELVGPFVVRGRKGSATVRYEALASAYNSELQKRLVLDKSLFQKSGLRMKSAAHVREFFKRTDRGLEIGQAIAPVRDRFIALRSMLRDITSASVPPAMQAKSGLGECSIASCFAGAGCSNDKDVGSTYKKKKARSCKACDSQGRGKFWRLRQIGSTCTTRFVCSNTICELYECDDRVSLSEVPKPKSKPCCVHCRAAGLGEFGIRRSGSRENTQLHCDNPECILLTGIFSAQITHDSIL